MRLDQWHQNKVEAATRTKQAINDRAIDLAKFLGVSVSDPQKMELLTSFAILENEVGGGQPLEGNQ